MTLLSFCLQNVGFIWYVDSIDGWGSEDFIQNKSDKAAGLRPTVEIWRILIVVLCQAGNVPLGFGLFGKIIDSGSLPTVVTYTFLIKGLLKARMLSEAIGVWDIMVIASVAVDRRLAALDTKLY
ncbi:putative pentatricopeptide repeat-containing protein At1g31840 [Asparagus officinalis]|uniref:putative pentatricopeptide repeat-containing protein At1g31840 n=1 Tax=Asparagus officinalis TaxID=4686 RepID=UPI00098E8074|nr:putative pentatricopeptide repeat-containing protein At1g31840 [Asparagus officinalis]